MEALYRLEHQEFVGVLIFMNKVSGDLRVQAIDADGDVIFDEEGAKPSPRQPAFDVMAAFN
eukprot:3401492-Rhodomonas_salina.1